jgi:hypothetical protein
VCKLSFLWHVWASLKRELNEGFEGQGPRVHTGENSQILTVPNNNNYLNLRAPKKKLYATR